MKLERGGREMQREREREREREKGLGELKRSLKFLPWSSSVV